MNKNVSLKNAKWLKGRRRINKIKKQNNYVNKTHKGVDVNTLRDNLRRKGIEKIEEKNKMNILSKVFGLNKNEGIKDQILKGR